MKKIFLTLGIFSCVFFYAQKGESYYEINYTSICCGPPATAPIMNFLGYFKSKYNVKAIEILQQSGLGREGEFNLYIANDNFTPSQKSALRNGLKDAIAKQNERRNKNSMGTVQFDESKIIKKQDLINYKNITIYKNERKK